MAKVHSEITDDLADWIASQEMYFVASAPLSDSGHVNVSPRGVHSLRILDPHQVLLLDLTGSGNETAAHVTENSRLTVMFCAFSGKPKILRLYGNAKAILPGHKKWDRLRAEFPDSIPAVRQLFLLDVTRVQTSCGFGVPLMDFVAQRDILTEWSAKRDEPELIEYRQNKNAESIDGLTIPVNSSQ
ncbi:MAG: pyridoxamine 5'-phosphate oxidase family protein [Gammaproteobacteria bacterium]